MTSNDTYTQVVDQSSGFIGSPREEKDFIHADHRSMCRFSNNQDHGYLKVEAAIEDCYNHAIVWASSRNETAILSMWLPT